MSNDWDPDKESSADENEIPVARVVTARPVQLRLVVGEDSRAPAGHVVFRTLVALDGEVPDDAPAVARGSLPAPMFAAIEAAAVFAEPVIILLDASESEHGIQGTISALVPAAAIERITRVMRSEEEPWLKGESFEESGYHDTNDEAPDAMMPLALGAVVRFTEDRRHPDRLDLEAVDLLATLMTGKGMDADQKRIEHLLRSL